MSLKMRHEVSRVRTAGGCSQESFSAANYVCCLKSLGARNVPEPRRALQTKSPAVRLGFLFAKINS